MNLGDVTLYLAVVFLLGHLVTDLRNIRQALPTVHRWALTAAEQEGYRYRSRFYFSRKQWQIVVGKSLWHVHWDTTGAHRDLIWTGVTLFFLAGHLALDLTRGG